MSKSECLTPDAIFHIYIHPRSIIMSFDMSRTNVLMHLNKNEALDLENQLQNAIEKVMAPFFKIKQSTDEA